MYEKIFESKASSAWTHDGISVKSLIENLLTLYSLVQALANPLRNSFLEAPWKERSQRSMHLFLDTRTSFSMYHSHWRYLIRGPWLRFLFQSNTITIRILSKCQEYDNLWLVLGAQRIFADHAFNVTHDSAIVQRAGHHETYPWLILYKITNNKWAILVLKYPLWWLLPRNKRPKTSEKHEIRTVNLTDWFEFFSLCL